MPPGLTYEQAWQVGQTLFLVLLGLGGAWAAWRQSRRKRTPAGEKLPLPSETPVKPHPDPIVEQMRGELKRLSERSEAQQRELTGLTKELGTTRRSLGELEGKFWRIRRVFRRFIDAWPAGHEMPHLTADEADLVGVDGIEDTIETAGRSRFAPPKE